MPTDLKPIQRDDASGRITSKWAGTALLGALAIVLAMIAVDVLVIDGAQTAPARPIVNVVKVARTTQVERTVGLSVSPGVKPGPDGQLHDAFSVTNFTVRVGQPVTLVINNTDTS